MAYYEVDLRGGGPWGFRLQGGKDFGQALSISRITPGGKADVQGIAAGDVIYSINEQVVENMSHMDAQNCIKNAGQDLKLTLQRSRGDNNNRSPIVINQTTHSAKSDHKFNAKPRPFGAPSSSPSSSPSPPQSVSPAYYPPPPPPPAPAPQPTHTSYASPRKPPVQPPDDSDVLRRLQETRIHDDSSSGLKSAASNVDSFQREMNRLQLAASDGDGDETEYMGYMRQPEESGLSRAKVQSKSFKMLQHHLGTDDDLPPPPPEAYLEEEDNQPQSRTFQMLQNSVDGGTESHPSVFSRPVEDRSKASNIPLPKQYQPHNPTPIKRAGASNMSQVSHPGAPMVLPGQPQPVALPGMIKKQPVPPPTAPHIHPVPTLSRDPSTRTGGIPAPPPAPASYGIPPPRSNNPPPQIHGPPKTGGGPGGPRPPPQSNAPRPGGPKPAGGRDGPRAPYCNGCNEPINGPFVSAIGKSWHPEHFRCASCDRPLQDIGFVEEQGKLYCENDYNQHFAPRCADCNQPITGPCVQAIGQNFHPEHFRCGACGKELGNEGFMLDGGKPFCQKCYKDFFCVKCAGCKNVIGGLDRWIEAIDATWHAACFCCSDCNRPLENSEFFVASGKPYCPDHGSMR